MGVGALGALIGGGAMLLAQPAATPAERGKIESVVRDYILANPEIITEAIGKLREREVGKVVAANRAAFETPYRAAFAGNAGGDVTLVEFFDYACGYCRASEPVLQRLIAEDRNLRIVFRELPVLGPDSEAAALVSLSAAEAGRYMPFHSALFAAGRPEAAVVARVSAANQIAVTQASPAAREEIARNRQLADAIGITGTPAFIVGTTVFTGAVGYDTLKKAIADTRAARR